MGAPRRPALPDRRADRHPRRQHLDPARRCRDRERWFSWPDIAFLAPVPVITALLAFGEWQALRRGARIAAVSGAIGLFLMSFVGIAISLWPMIVPYHYTLVAGGLVAGNAGLSADRHAVPVADHSDVHRLVLLGVPRQGPRRPRLPSLERDRCVIASRRQSNPAPSSLANGMLAGLFAADQPMDPVSLRAPHRKRSRSGL